MTNWTEWGLDRPLETTKQALSAVNRWGFCHVIGKRGQAIPSLWRSALSPGWHTVGPWINDLAERRLVYSANMIGNLASVISLRLLPALVAMLAPVSLEDEYEAGSLGRVEFEAGARVFEALNDNEPLATTEIPLAGGLARSDVQLGLKLLQRYALIAKVGVREKNWVVQIWSPVSREFPDAVEAGMKLTREQGASIILEAFSRITGISDMQVLARKMRWKWAFERIHMEA